MSDKDVAEKSETALDDAALEKLAVEELMQEAVQGAARAEVVGPSGWIKVSQKKPNKKFLVNTIRNAVASNNYHYSKRHHTHKSSSKSTSKKKEKSRDLPIEKDKSKKISH